MIKFEQGKPIYLQIVDDIKGQILSGQLRQGEKLPSVRELAGNYAVNPNTISRVFMELEKEDLTYSERGVGTFVKEKKSMLQELRQEEVRELVASFVRGMKSLGFDHEGLVEALEKFLEED